MNEENIQGQSFVVRLLKKGYTYRLDIFIINVTIWFFLLYIGKNYSIATMYKGTGIVFFAGLFYYFYRIYKDT